MKISLKRVLLIFSIILLCAALFVGLILLPVGNNISLYWRTFPQAPGSLPPTWMLPKAEKSDIGQTVNISFPQLLADSQYDDQDPLNADQPEVMHIVYLENANRLAVIAEVENNHDWATLTVYEPDWSGTQNLFANRGEEFDAKIIHRQNISWMEGITYIGNQINRDMQEDPTLAIDPNKYTGASQGKCVYGRFYYGKEEIGQAITDDITATFLAYDLSKLTTQNDVFLRIVEKYDLSQHLGI